LDTRHNEPGFLNVDTKKLFVSALLIEASKQMTPDKAGAAKYDGLCTNSHN
jgi:hypothetical protein